MPAEHILYPILSRWSTLHPNFSAKCFLKRPSAEKSGCKVDQLDKIGYKICSAGTLNINGSPASKEAVEACAAKNVDLTGHRSSGLTESLIEQSDFIFVMSQNHLDYIVENCPGAANKCLFLAENEEIPDPIGQPQLTYNNCADLIENAVKKRISELNL